MEIIQILRVKRRRTFWTNAPEVKVDIELFLREQAINVSIHSKFCQIYQHAFFNKWKMEMLLWSDPLLKGFIKKLRIGGIYVFVWIIDESLFNSCYKKAFTKSWCPLFLKIFLPKRCCDWKTLFFHLLLLLFTKLKALIQLLSLWATKVVLFRLFMFRFLLAAVSFATSSYFQSFQTELTWRINCAFFYFLSKFNTLLKLFTHASSPRMQVVAK